MLRVESTGSKVFIRAAFAEVHDLILEHPFKSFHEILHKDVNKMYFDIDSEDPVDETLLNQAIVQILDKLLTAKIQPVIHKCTAYSENQAKFSHHIIIDIKCTKRLNSYLASEMNAKYQCLARTK